MRMRLMLTTLAVIAGLGAAGCSSDSSTTDGATTSGDGGVADGPTSTGTDAPASSSGMACFTGSGSGSCTVAEETSYENCVFSACKTQVTTCFGANVLSGTYGGTCGTYLGCTTKCGCSNPNTTCLLACGTPPADCLACIQTVEACENASASTCPKPACMQTPDAGALPDLGISIPDGFPSFDGLPDLDALSGGHTCADLLACCNAQTDVTKKAACTQAYTSAMAAGDSFCGIAYTGLKAAGVCQ